MSLIEPEKWRKCNKCICNGSIDCDVACDRAESIKACHGPYKSFRDHKRRTNR